MSFRSTAITSLVARAVDERRLVSFIYQGRPRVVDPHVLGVSNGHVELQSFQVAGLSRSGHVPDWRRFDVALAGNMQVLSEHFHGPRPFPSGRHSSFDQINAVVKSQGWP